MDVELIRNRFINNEPRKVNKELIKKIIITKLKNGTLPNFEIYELDDFCEKNSNDKEAMKELREVYNEEKENFIKYVNKYFGSSNKSTVVTDQEDQEEQNDN